MSDNQIISAAEYRTLRAELSAYPEHSPEVQALQARRVGAYGNKTIASGGTSGRQSSVFQSQSNAKVVDRSGW